jgi:hypothetical protein
VTAIICGAAAFYFIRKTNWAVSKKKNVFALLTAFAVFPVLVPVTIVGIPVPNIVFVVLSIINFEIQNIPSWYFRIWTFHVPSYALTALLLRGAAAMLFYKYCAEEKEIRQ